MHEKGNPDAHIYKIWYEVTENDTGAWRDATLRFADQWYTIYQAPYAAPCPVVVSPTAVTSIGAEGGSATITVTSECEWQAITHDGFITITSGAFGVRNGAVTIFLAANPNGGDRVGELFIGTQVVAVRQPGQNLQDTDISYFHTDGIGSVRLITNAAGEAQAGYDYLPFGADALGTSTLNSDHRLLFTGKERDQETQFGDKLAFDYFGARYYQSQWGRFTSPDVPGVDQNPQDPQSWNLYSYVRNNPLRYVDPTGLKCENGYDAEKRVFCTETIGEDPWRRADEAWQAAERFFLDSLFAHLLTPRVSNFAAGVGDALTGRMIPGVNTSLTEYVRNQMGTDGVVAKGSSSYSAGTLAGGTVGWTLAGSASATAAAIANGKAGALFGRGGEALFNQGPVRFGWYWKGPATTGRDVVGLRIGPARGTNWWSHIPFWHP